MSRLVTHKAGCIGASGAIRECKECEYTLSPERCRIYRLTMGAQLFTDTVPEGD